MLHGIRLEHALPLSKIKLLFSLMTLVFLLSACGSEVSITKEGECANTADGGVLCLKLTDANGNIIRDVERNSSATIVATIRNADNNGISGAVVDFATTEGELTLDSGLTNNGVASTTLTTGAERKVGKLTVTFTDESGETATSLSVSYGFTIGATQEDITTPVELTGEGACKSTSTGGLLCLKLTNNAGELLLDIDTEATANLTATLKNASNTNVQGTSVTFSSTFSALSQNSGTTQSNGEATTILTAGTDRQSSSATVTIDDNGTQLDVSYAFTIGENDTDPETNPNVSTSITGAIEFIAATPTTLALRHTGGTGLNEFSIVQFRIIGTDGLPMANRTVNFNLNTNIGGLDIDPISTVSDTNGIVTTTLQSGSVPTAIRITASSQMTDLNGEVQTIFTQSDQLVVSTGLPDQNSMSISVGVKNPEAWSHDGVEVPVTVRLADHFNNPVPDGTAVYFTTEGGAIQPSCFTQNGSCTVNWVSQNPRPSDHRVTILATALGTESFHDTNSDGRYSLDDGEPYADTNNNNVFDEAFVDANDNNIFDEPFLDDRNGKYDPGEVFSDALNGTYDGQFIHFTGVTIPAEEFVDIGNGQYDLGEEITNDVNGNNIYDARENFEDADSDGVFDVGEIYVDTNGNGQYDPGDSYNDQGDGVWNLGEPFTDALNGVYDPGEAFIDEVDGVYEVGEWFIDYNGNGVYDGNGNNPIGETVFTDSNNGNSLYDGWGRAPLGESHTDAIANSFFDGPGFPDLAEPFLDSNENGKYDIGEMYVDTNNNDSIELVGDGQYNGTLCIPNNNCSPEKTLHIRDSAIIIMSSSNSLMTLKNAVGNIIYISNDPRFSSQSTDIVIPNGSSVSLRLKVTDTAGQVMPAETIISVSASGVKLTGASKTIVPSTIGSSYNLRYSGSGDEIAEEIGHTLNFTLTDLDADEPDTTSLNISITLPSGLIMTYTVTIHT